MRHLAGGRGRRTGRCLRRIKPPGSHLRCRRGFRPREGRLPRLAAACRCSAGREQNSPGPLRHHWRENQSRLGCDLTWETLKQSPELLLCPARHRDLPLQQSSLQREEVLGVRRPEDGLVTAFQLPLCRLPRPQQLQGVLAQHLTQLLNPLSEC